jgi:hypothetical protein
MATTDELLSEIESFIQARQMAGARISETTFGRLVMNDWGFVRRLREGGTVTLRTAEKVKAYISEHSNGAAA